VTERTEYSEMTVTERLHCAGLAEEWDVAVAVRNRGRMVELLGKVDLADKADWIADKVLASPPGWPLISTIRDRTIMTE
jgi:hypothetical protein